MHSAIAHYDFGGHGPILLLLHATGFHAHVLKPMVKYLKQLFRCIAFDAPGHGQSSAIGSSIDFHDYAEQVRQAILGLGLKGCFCFGHSLGGCTAMLIESKHAGTFAALYLYEPVVCTPDVRQELLARRDPNNIAAQLGTMARKRRRHFPTKQAVLASLGSKQPFSSFDADVLTAFIDHGLRPSEGGFELCCNPDGEAAIYDSLEPPLAVIGTQITCPVVIAVGADNDTIHGRLTRFGAQMQATIPGSQLHRFNDLDHMGPLMAPSVVAGDVLNFFKQVLLFCKQPSKL